MRIIAGQFRGRTLLAPASDATRPVTDRVKQSLFDVLAPLLPGARVFDCFAGTGSMGLECLSRGATHATFFEADRSAAALLRRNIEALRVADRSTVVTGDLFRWFANEQRKSAEVDLIFFDPPYRFLQERPGDLQQSAASMAQFFLQPDGFLVFRHAAADALALPPFTAVRVLTYGSMTVELLAPPGTQADVTDNPASSDG